MRRIRDEEVKDKEEEENKENLNPMMVVLTRRCNDNANQSLRRARRGIGVEREEKNDEHRR